MSTSVDAGQKLCDLAALPAEYREPYWRDRCERALAPYAARPASVGSFCGIPLEAFTRDELLTVLHVLGNYHLWMHEQHLETLDMLCPVKEL